MIAALYNDRLEVLLSEHVQRMHTLADIAGFATIVVLLIVVASWIRGPR